MNQKPVPLSERLTAGEYFFAFWMAITSRHPLKNCGRVLAHLFGLTDLGMPPNRPQVSSEPQVSLPDSADVGTGKIYHTHRWGVYVAYILDEAPPVDEPAVQPRPGMMVFSDEVHVTVKTGTRADLARLAQDTGLPLVAVDRDVFFVPYTSSSSCDDALRWGHLILTFAQAAAQTELQPIPVDESPEV